MHRYDGAESILHSDSTSLEAWDGCGSGLTRILIKKFDGACYAF